MSFILDYDPKVIEEKEQSQPTCLPLSYVLRFVSENSRDTSGGTVASSGGNATSGQALANTSGGDAKRKLVNKQHTYSVSSSNRSNTPTGYK